MQNIFYQTKKNVLKKQFKMFKDVIITAFLVLNVYNYQCWLID